MYSSKQIVLLIVCTAGTVLYLFLLTLFAGLRRRKVFEVVLFLTGIALFLQYSGELLRLNNLIYRLQQSAAPSIFSDLFALALGGLGSSFLPPLLIHAHAEYWRRVSEGRSARWLYVLVGLFYLPALLSLVMFGSIPSDPKWMSHANLRTIEILLFTPWYYLAFFLSAVMQLLFTRRETRAPLSRLHIALAVSFMLFLAVGVFPGAAAISGLPNVVRVFRMAAAGSFVLLLPGALLGYYAIRNQFLRFGVQRNLIITVSLAFLALLYLTLAQRVSEWLEPYFPPIATRSVLIFLLVIFFEPLQRRVGKVLQRAFRAEAEQLQRLTAEIQHVASAGNLAALVTFSETRVCESFSLSGVRISLHDGPLRPATVSGNVQRFPLRNGPTEIGVLEAYFFGQALSGETHAALDYLSEQLPAAIDLCRLLDEKLRLERELAERERLALLGQMAASVSHNLRNPLSSIKTLLQLQLENPGLPASARPDCEKAIAEVDRLNAKLTQLLRYAKPQVRAGSGAATARVDVAAVAVQVVSLLQHEAERRGVALTFECAVKNADVAGSEEALGDVLSNLIVNAIEAVPAGGSVRVSLTRRDAAVELEIMDDGPGIPESVRPRIFQPFFTTKPAGTGLGLAIVEKRLAEIGATIDCESPVLNSRGTRFVVTLKSVGAGL